MQRHFAKAAIPSFISRQNSPAAILKRTIREQKRNKSEKFSWFLSIIFIITLGNTVRLRHILCAISKKKKSTIEFGKMLYRHSFPPKFSPEEDRPVISRHFSRTQDAKSSVSKLRPRPMPLSFSRVTPSPIRSRSSSCPGLFSFFYAFLPSLISFLFSVSSRFKKLV